MGNRQLKIVSDFRKLRGIYSNLTGTYIKGGVQAYHFEKNDFELVVGGEGQDTSQNFEGSFGSIRAILPRSKNKGKNQNLN